MKVKFAVALMLLLFGNGTRSALAEASQLPQLYLSWNAPYGAPGATDTLTAACGDTSRADTLYLSFDPRRDSPTFFGMIAVINVRPAPGETLGRYWELGDAQGKDKRLRADLDLDGTLPCPQPWKMSGYSRNLINDFADGVVINLLYAVRSIDAAPVKAGTIYCFARLIFFHRPGEPTGCPAPACIEWESAQLGFGPGQAVDVDTGGARFVSWNSPTGAICGEIRGRPPRWKPTRSTSH
jgi:hypothetical protein